jgi:phosphatidylserine synthase
MAETVYLLCALTSLVCAALLLRAYDRTGTRLLFWSGLCFVGLAANNSLLVVDLLVVPDVDLRTWRLVPAVLGLGLLLYGLVWEVE